MTYAAAVPVVLSCIYSSFVKNCSNIRKGASIIVVIGALITLFMTFIFANLVMKHKT